MAEPTWLIYVGAVTGSVGAIAGIVGAVVARTAIKRTDQIKALELRLELRTLQTALHEEIQKLPMFLEQAKISRTRLAAAQGSYGSGATQQWISSWETDCKGAELLAGSLPDLEVDCTGLSLTDLEQRLVAIRTLQRQVAELLGKYRGFLATDDQGREQLAADRRVLTQARLEGKS